MKTLLFLFLFITFISYSNCSLEINFPNDDVSLKNIDTKAVVFPMNFDLHVRGVETELYYLTGEELCNKNLEDMEELRGKIVLGEPYAHPCMITDSIRRLGPLGLTAVLQAPVNWLDEGGDIGQLGVIFDWQPNPFPIPMFEIHRSYALLIEKEYRKNPDSFPLTVVLTEDENPWVEYFGRAPVYDGFQIVLSFLAFVCVIMASVKIYFHFLPANGGGGRRSNGDGMKKKGGGGSTTLWILLPELVSNILRLIYFAVDPVFFHTYFDVVTGNIFLDITLPISLFTSLLIGFHWFYIYQQSNQAMSKKASDLLIKIRIPALVVTGFLFLLQIVASVLRAIRVVDINLSLVSIILVNAFTLIVAVIFIFAGAKILNTLNQTAV